VVNEDKVVVRQLIRTWHERARIDYSDLYVKEYIAYNAWSRKVTDCSEDHEAIKRVMERFVIWDDYLHGRTMNELQPIAEQISLLTWREPVRSAGSAWNGVVYDGRDWKGLIYFWYQTRCELFHGITMPGRKVHDRRIKLAYESLRVFMSEIMKRMRRCFSDKDYAKLTEVKRLLKSESGPAVPLRKIETTLHQIFIHSPDLWNVDMERV
jgi:hypothetical protein